SERHGCELSLHKRGPSPTGSCRRGRRVTQRPAREVFPIFSVLSRRAAAHRPAALAGNGEIVPGARHPENTFRFRRKNERVTIAALPIPRNLMRHFFLRPLVLCAISAPLAIAGCAQEAHDVGPLGAGGEEPGPGASSASGSAHGSSSTKASSG